MSKRVRSRLSQGRQPAFRRAPIFETLEYDAPGFVRRKYEQGASIDDPIPRDRDDRPQYFAENEHGLPALVLCPACGLRQLADPVALRCV
jgi:hypothetical protein